MAMSVTPLPAIGDVITGRDIAGRELRISGHPESDRTVLSIWQSGRCLATVRLARADVPEVARALVAGLVPLPEQDHLADRNDPDSRADSVGTVHELRRSDVGADVVRELTERLGAAVTNLLPGRIADRLRRFGSPD
jgi:hypothetical protein